MTPMTEDELAAIEARASMATPGPWYTTGDHPYVVAKHTTFGLIVARALNDDNRALIAHARADVPALVAEVRRLRAEVDAALRGLRLQHDVAAQIEREACLAIADEHAAQEDVAGADACERIAAKIRARGEVSRG